LIDEAIQKRSDVAASRADLLAKEAAVSAATSDLWPTLSLGGTADRRWTEYFGDSKAYKHYYEYTAYMKVAWDVFDGFDNWAKRKEAVADMKSQREQLREDELAASADVWSKYYAFRTATSKFEFSKAFLQSSEESFYLALEGYRAGLKDILDLLEAYSKLSSARSSYVQSKNDILVALAEIAHAVGSLGEKGSVEYMKARSKK
jgi:outer membrane protein TolC